MLMYPAAVIMLSPGVTIIFDDIPIGLDQLQRYLRVHNPPHLLRLVLAVDCGRASLLRVGQRPDRLLLRRGRPMDTGRQQGLLQSFIVSIASAF